MATAGVCGRAYKHTHASYYLIVRFGTGDVDLPSGDCGIFLKILADKRASRSVELQVSPRGSCVSSSGPKGLKYDFNIFLRHRRCIYQPLPPPVMPAKPSLCRVIAARHQKMSRPADSLVLFTHETSCKWVTPDDCQTCNLPPCFSPLL